MEVIAGCRPKIEVCKHSRTLIILHECHHTWSCGFRHSCCLRQQRTVCGLGDQYDSSSLMYLHCKLVMHHGQWGWQSRVRGEKEEWERGRTWPSAEGLTVGLALRGGSLAGKEEYGGRNGHIGRGCLCTGGKILRKKLIKWVIEN